MTTEISPTRAGLVDEQRPNPEVVERPKRRTFTAGYRMEKGQVGALLRREGLYASHLTDRRKQRDRGALTVVGPTRGPQAEVHAGGAGEPEAEAREREGGRNWKARVVIDVQKNVAALLGIALERAEIIKASVSKLAPTVGTAAACKALCIPRTTAYPWRKLQTKTTEDKQRSSLRALSA
jgi:transposase